MAFQNYYIAKLANVDIGANDSVIQIDTLPIATSGYLVIEPRNPSKREIISYTGVTSTPSPRLTGVTRGIDGTTATPHLNGSIIQMNVVAKHLQDLYDAYNSFAAANSDWRNLVTATTVAQQNGNRSTDLSTVGDQTVLLSKGMRLRLPRTGTAVQTQSVSLNGTNQYFNRTTVNGMTFTDDFTVGAWIYRTAESANPMIIFSRFNGTSGWYFYLDASGKVFLVATNGGAANTSGVNSTQSIPLNRWVHVTAQLDMSSFTVSSTTSYVTIDGVDVPAQVTRTGTNPTSLVQAGNLELGSYNGGALPFTGMIAQAFVTSAKITQASIRSFANSSITPAIVSANNIVSAYSGGGNVNDINTSNANNLSSQNAAGYATGSPFNATAYAIIMTDPVFTGGNTVYTVQSPWGNPIPSETLGTVAYSGASVPSGFPKQKGKWRIESIVRTQASVNGPSAGAWYNIVNQQIVLGPAAQGAYNVGFRLSVGSYRTTAGSLSFLSTASTSANSASHSEFTVWSQGEASASTFGHRPLLTTELPLELLVSANTPIYLNVQAGTSGTVDLAVYGDQTATRIYADNGLL